MALKEIARYSEQSYEIRPAKNDVEAKQIWCPFMINLGWDRGTWDYATYMSHSHSRGMLLAFPRESDQPIGCVSAIINDNSTGWVATFIVDPGYQGVGIGAGLWNSMMTDFQSCDTEIIGLDAVPAQKPTYERRGFVASELGIVKLMMRPISLPATGQDPETAQNAIIDIREVPARLLAEYDIKYSGFQRPKLWNQVLNRSDAIGFVAALKTPIETVDDIAACALVRRCPGGARLGPVYAENASVAQSVLSKAVAAITPEYVYDQPIEGLEMSEWPKKKVLEKATVVAEVWDGNADAVALFEKFGWQAFGDYPRMWWKGRATAPQSPGGIAQKGYFATFDAAIG